MCTRAEDLGNSPQRLREFPVNQTKVGAFSLSKHKPVRRNTICSVDSEATSQKPSHTLPTSSWSWHVATSRWVVDLPG
jgi:hypothetical protein